MRTPIRLKEIETRLEAARLQAWNDYRANDGANAQTFEAAGFTFVLDRICDEAESLTCRKGNFILIHLANINLFTSAQIARLVKKVWEGAK